MTNPDFETSGTKSSPIVIQSEGSSFKAGIILNDTNYDLWSQIMEMHIAEKEKLSFIRGNSQPPTKEDDLYEKWYVENQKVKRWLLMSMSPEIMKRYIRLPTARDIWKALSKAFYDGSDELQVFVLNQRAFSAKQSGRTLSAYYGELTEFFGELDHRDKVIMESENDVESYRKSVQRQRVHIFLAGLDGEFEQVRAEILRKDPIPELEACHALIRRESVRRTKMVEESETTEASTMVTRYRPSQNQLKPTNAADKSTYKCTHCNQNGHTKNRCYELVGYPECWDHNRDPRKRNSKRTSSTAVVETKTEDDVTGQHSALAAAAGNGGKALNMSTLVTNNAWIIDSGATDHMTFDSRQVSTLKQSSQKFVTTANGTLAPIVGEGHLTLTSNMNLDSVLVVSSLDYNLLSVSQITTALFCVVIFWPNFCVFKDICTGQTIGCGVRRGKLYYLDLVSKSSDKLRQALMVNDSEGEMRKSEIWLWHRRLGHASFGYAAHQKGYRCYHPPTHKMFITLDVVFYEDLMYFSTESELQGEHQKEIQTLDYDDELAENVDVHISEDTQISEDAGNLDISEDELAEPVNQVGKFVEKSSQEHAETEVVTPSQSEFDIPHATNTPHQSLAEDAPEPHRKQLPQRNDPEEREALQGHLSREFKMKDLGPLKYFLGIEVSRSNKWIFMSQRKYALDLLRETGMLACQPVDTPVEEGLKLRIESNQVPVDKGRYQRLVGRLMYLAHTRPDLAYALSIVSQYMHNPGEQHMNAVLRILRYLKSAHGQGILFTKNEDHQSVDVYTDADWAGAVDDRRSTSSYFTFVGGNLVKWRSKKQNVVARSSAEAEFRGIALGVCEALWLRLLLQDLGCVSKQPIKLYCNNKAACDIAHNPVQHDRTKHVEIDRFFIKEKLDEKIVELPHIRSEDQLADILTKAVSSRVFSKFLSKLGIWDIYAPT
ncbi:hypothetical protein RJ640_001998 [Escallonia rubra]|uniref:Retrovirus-related Pol polyprotein from transposon RE1 n=1 Tax=Escallonia rubra TaxID=112253 RepID=A0AA88RFP8_9ASTE|nr:hypothetical protein RJ640_001998 [Escallonia rubra]